MGTVGASDQVHFPAGTDPATVDLVAGTSLPAVWAARWADEPQRPVLWDGPTGWLTAGELARRTEVAAGRLYGAGLRKGDRVVLSAAPSIDLVVAHVAALRLGLIVVPVNGAYQQGELAHIVGDAAPRAAVVDQPPWVRWLAELAPELLVVSPRLDLADATALSLDQLAGGDPALLGYTSGTTGAPKGAVLTHANLLAGARSVGIAWRWTPEDRLVLALPLFHMHGLGVGLHGTLLAGASAVLVPGFSPDAVLDAAQAHDATLFFGVPTMYSRLAQSPRVAGLSRLRLCVSGSAPLPADLHHRLGQKAGVRVLERYGMTETIMLVSNPYDGERRAGTVGFPLPGVELRLAPETGEVQVRGPNVFPGYWRRPEATAAAFDADGWFRTGDLGAFDSDGYLVLQGRATELVISGGLNVYPREVEDALRSHPDVEDVAVTGTPDDEWGELVTAWVVAAGKDAPTLEQLRHHLDGVCAPFKHPRILHLVGELPRNALGKVQKHLLA
ncbi:acyl-CoA synthetase [Candidatus Poriferisocius sp.]|uniref:acyl-CoA synthetase n=1 Tax=Candidatus Poriferisocius sp. TaxID=3101276 RepID=UPI003B5C74A6